MRRANRSGSITKLSGKRHKPWAVRITDGYDPDGKQIRHYAGYFATKREAQRAIDAILSGSAGSKTMTLKQAWEGWAASYTGSPNTITAYKAAFNRAYLLHEKNLEEITLDEMQAVADQEPRTYARAKAVQKVFSALLEYGFAHDACPAGRKDLLKYIQLPPSRQKKEKEDKRFTDDEIQSVIDQHCILAVILICTGLRRSELIGMKREDIDLDRQMISVRQSKTENGIRRVPIPDRLIPWMEEYIRSGAIGRSREFIDHNLWTPYNTFGHVKHHCRHTYISILTETGADERMVKTLAGHAGGVTLDVYTHYKDSFLIETVNAAFAKYLPVIENGSEDYSDRLRA